MIAMMSTSSRRNPSWDSPKQNEKLQKIEKLKTGQKTRDDATVGGSTRTKNAKMSVHLQVQSKGHTHTHADTVKWV